MKEISINKKYKVIKLFLSGDTFDEIALKVGIAKGSTVNIVDAFRNGELQIAPNEYTDALRELAVDIRKQNTNVKKLKMYITLDQKLAEMGVSIDEVDDWLDIVQDIATEPAAMKPFVSAALELFQMETETGLNCASLVAEYKKYSNGLNNFKAELSSTIELKKKADTDLDAVNKQREAAKGKYEAETANLKAKLDKHVIESQLNWNLVDTVKAILHDKLGKEGLDEKDKLEISKQIANIGALAGAFKAMKKESDALEKHLLDLKEEAKNFELSNTALQKHNDQLAGQVYGGMQEIKALETQIKETDLQLGELKSMTHGYAEDIYTGWLVLAFLQNPEAISNYDFDHFAEIINGVRMARLGQKPKQAVDAGGKVICQCHVPLPYTPFKDYGVATDEARENLTEHLVTLVKGKFVPKFEYQSSQLTQKILEMQKQLTAVMLGKPYEPAQTEILEQNKTKEGVKPDQKPAEPPNANPPIPKELTTLGLNEDYSPEAMKAKWEMEKAFLKKMGPRIIKDSSLPWKEKPSP